ncbi:MAG: helix-hairpin-helix domain-containing protein [Bdellovibrionota bacterium]
MIKPNHVAILVPSVHKAAEYLRRVRMGLVQKSTGHQRLDPYKEFEGVTMKAKKSSEASRLEQIPNVGKAVAQDLRNLGITSPDQLNGKNGLVLYHKLNKVTGVRHDPCMADTLMAAVDFMNGGKPKPWWKFTGKRKILLKG